MIIPDDETRCAMATDWLEHVGLFNDEQIDTVFECMESFDAQRLFALSNSPIYVFAAVAIVVFFLGSGDTDALIVAWEGIDPQPESFADRVLAMLEVCGTPEAAAFAIVERARRKS